MARILGSPDVTSLNLISFNSLEICFFTKDSTQKQTISSPNRNLKKTNKMFDNKPQLPCNFKCPLKGSTSHPDLNSCLCSLDLHPLCFGENCSIFLSSSHRLALLGQCCVWDTQLETRDHLCENWREFCSSGWSAFI